MSKYIGSKVAGIKADQPWLPISQIKVKVDENNIYTAGTTTGRTVEVDCAIGTQAIADALLSVLSGYVYKAYEATDAIIDPDLELGQAVSVSGVYSIVGGIFIKGDMILAADLSAPSSGDIDHEYPFTKFQKVVVAAKNIKHGGAYGTFSGRGLTNETVGSNVIETGAVITRAIASLAITAQKIADAAVETPKLNDGAVTGLKIADAAIETPKLYDGAVTGPKIGAEAVETAKIKDLAVSTGKIAGSAVTNAKVSSGINTSLADADYAADVFAGIVTADYGKFGIVRANSVFTFKGHNFAVGDASDVVSSNYKVMYATS